MAAERRGAGEQGGRAEIPLSLDVGASLGGRWTRDKCVEREGRAPVARFERARSRRRGRGARRRVCVAALRSPLGLAERSPHRRPWDDAVTPAMARRPTP